MVKSPLYFIKHQYFVTLKSCTDQLPFQFQSTTMILISTTAMHHLNQHIIDDLLVYKNTWSSIAMLPKVTYHALIESRYCSSPSFLSSFFDFYLLAKLPHDNLHSYILRRSDLFHHSSFHIPYLTHYSISPSFPMNSPFHYAMNYPFHLPVNYHAQLPPSKPPTCH